MTQLRRWHISVICFFTFLGMGISALFVRMPEIKAALAVSSAELGFVLVGGSAGAVATIIFTGKLVSRFGTKPVLTAGYLMSALSLIGATFAIEMHSVLWTVVALFTSFAGYAAADVSINVDGSHIEQELKRSVLPRMHAAYSLGAFIGAGLGTLAVTFNVSLPLQIAIISIIMMLVPFVTWKTMPLHIGQELHHKDKTQEKVKGISAWSNPTVILLGFGIIGITLAEGASNDWLTLGFVEGLGQNATNAGIAYVVLQIAMTSMRFFGGRFVDKFGKKNVIRVLALTGVAGILLVILGNNLILGWIGSALWGFGVALGFPLFISAAGEGKNAAKQVSLVATFGYLSFLFGPPLLGLLAESLGILNMFYVLVVSLSAAAYFAKATNKTSV